MDDPRRGIQSIEIGGKLLQALVRAGRSLKLGDLAREADMPPAKAHGYLVSFGKLELIEQDPITGEYGLGRFALQIGLTALQRLDPLRLAQPVAAELAAEIDQTVAIAVWGSHGPTIVKIEEATFPLHVNLRTGTVMSLGTTATGLVFAAFLPPAQVAAMLEGEGHRAVGASPEEELSLEDIRRQLNEVRRRGLARAVGKPIPGVNALCAPVFDSERRLALAITALGPAGRFDADWDSPIAQALKRSCGALSARLGHTG